MISEFLITKLCIALAPVENKNVKIEKTRSIIEENIARNEKIIFSNSMRYLDCKKFLAKHNINCLLFTGELDQETRHRTLSLFKSDEKKHVLLLNSRIGGEGLTLTEANNVVFLNEWWNPSSNRQAEDRVNRIGQTRSIHLHVLRAERTIDEDIARILDDKTLVEHSFLKALIGSIDEKSL